jgi:hypothetical protein
MNRTNWVFNIQKSFDKLEFRAGEVPAFYYDKTNAVSKAENVDVADAVFLC